MRAAIRTRPARRAQRVLGLVAGLAAALAASPALAEKAAGEGWAGAASVVTAVQRLTFPAGLEPVTVEARALSKEIVVSASHPRRLRRSIAAQLSVHTLCGEPALRHGRLVLTCTTRRVVVLHPEPGVVVVLGLRTLPWRGPLDGPLPLRVPKGQAALLARDREALARARQALERGDLDAAARALRVLPTLGHFGRLAALYRLELFGNAVGRDPRDPIFDPTGLPSEARERQVLRVARIRAFAGDFEGAVALLDGAHPRGATASACRHAPALCRSIALAALREPDDTARAAGLELYLALSRRFTGPLALDLAEAAAAYTERIGLFSFAASLLSAVSAEVPRPELPGHLERIVSLYARGHQKVRVAFVREYASEVLSRRELKRHPSLRAPRRRGRTRRHRRRRPAPRSVETLQVAQADAPASGK